MSEKYKAHAPNGLYHMTMTVVGWIDVFTRSSYADLVLESLRYCQKHKGLTIYGYVIMSYHIHLVAWVDAPNTMPTDPGFQEIYGSPDPECYRDRA